MTVSVVSVACATRTRKRMASQIEKNTTGDSSASASFFALVFLLIRPSMQRPGANRLTMQSKSSKYPLRVWGRLSAVRIPGAGAERSA